MKNGIAVMRDFVRCLVTMEDICDIRESDTEQLRETKREREECTGLMINSQSLGKKGVHREKPDSVRAAKDKLSMMPLSKWK